MMSNVAYFVKDVVGPKGCVSIAGVKEGETASDDVEGHTKASLLRRTTTGLARTKGHIGFAGHHDEVHFRNIRLKPL